MSIYNDISTRTQGDIYIGVVGPVRTGKSTFIKRFMESLVIPGIDGEFQKERARDELPQSAAGRTIMTTEPKFIPEEAIELTMQENLHFRVRLIDCVGYIVPSSVGYIEEDQPRMVRTPWFEDEVPFNMAAEVGTEKVIREHSTIGLVVTTDGSISSIPRAEYEEAEERVIAELKEINKPFIVILNSTDPESESAAGTARQLSERYDVPVIPVNCLEMGEEEITAILERVLYEFPVTSISLGFPNWIKSLGSDNELRTSLFSAALRCCDGVGSLRSVYRFADALLQSKDIESLKISKVDLSNGSVHMKISIDSSYFYSILSGQCGVRIADERSLMREVISLTAMRKKYIRFAAALEETQRTGYGIVMPDIDELTLEEPEIMKQGGRYGVRLKAQAPSIHMIKCSTYAEVAPIVGSETQSRELVMYLLKEFEENPAELWNTDIFGKSLNELVNESLRGKLERMPDDARNKFRETIERVINEGCSGLICIIL